MNTSTTRALLAALSIAGFAACAFAAVASSDADAKPGSPSPSRDPRIPPSLRLSTERVVVFKDGHALVVKSATATLDATGAAFTEEVPEGAVLGTFWAWTDGGPTVKAMRAETVSKDLTREEVRPCEGPADVAAANPGHKVTIELEKTSLSGTVVSTKVSASSDGGVIDSPSVLALHVEGGGVVVVQDAQVQRVSGKELALQCRVLVPETKAQKRLTLEFGREHAGKKISAHLVYFTPGLRWLPTYRLETNEPNSKKGALSLQAELINELEDFDGVAFDLAVGVPNFRFKEVASPLSLEGMVHNALAQAAPSLMGTLNSMSNASFNQRAMEWKSSEGSGEDGFGDAAGAEGVTDGNDIFILPISSLRLPKGSRAVIPLSRDQVGVADVYTLDVHMRRASNGADVVQYGGRTASSWSPLKLGRAQVWHQLELFNTTKTPWSTGAALVMKGHVPLAQELLTYTPPESKTLLPLTIAVDVRAVHEEVELQRKPDALRIDSASLSLIRKRGTITISNPRPVGAPMRIRLSTGGKVDTVSKDGRVRIDDGRAEDWGGYTHAAQANSHSEVDWAFELGSGERRTLTYEVSFYR